MNIVKLQVTSTEGWDDFDIEESEPVRETNLKVENVQPKASSAQDTGWDNFGDWGESDNVKSEEVSFHRQVSNVSKK